MSLLRNESTSSCKFLQTHAEYMNLWFILLIFITWLLIGILSSWSPELQTLHQPTLHLILPSLFPIFVYYFQELNLRRSSDVLDKTGYHSKILSWIDMDKKVSMLGFATSTYMRSYVDFVFKDLSFSALDMLLTAKSDEVTSNEPLNNIIY